jgi:hypothetical protein
MILKDLHGFRDEIHRLQRGSRLSLQEKIGEPAKIIQRPFGINYARQVFALGFGTDLP